MKDLLFVLLAYFLLILLTVAGFVTAYEIHGSGNFWQELGCAALMCISSVFALIIVVTTFAVVSFIAFFIFLWFAAIFVPSLREKLYGEAQKLLKRIFK